MPAGFRASASATQLSTWQETLRSRVTWRNLPSGDVELVAEGAADQVEAFLATVFRALAASIEQCFVQDAASGGYKDFRIRY